MDWAASSNGPRSRPPVQWAAPTVGGRRPSAPLLPHSQLRQDKIRYSARARQAHIQHTNKTSCPPAHHRCHTTRCLSPACLDACYVRTGGLTHSRSGAACSVLDHTAPAGISGTDSSIFSVAPAGHSGLHHPLRHAASLRATDGRYGNGAATRERLPPVPAAVLEVSVSSCASGSAPSPGAAVRCGAGGCNRFCSCLTSKAPASQPASQPGVRRSVPRHGTYWRWPTEDGRCAAVLLRASSFNTSTHLGSVAELQSRSRSRPKNISRAALAQ